MQTQITDIGSRRELFVDEFLTDHFSGGAALRLHHPRPAGTALRYDQPWEGRFSGYPTVLYDSQLDRYRLYYRGWESSADHYTPVTCMAESPDGITFHKPDLGLFDVAGSRQNNVILTCAEDMYTHNFAPFLDDRPGVPEDQRYKAMTRNYGLSMRNQRSDPMGLFGFVSADGVNWRKLRDEPMITQGGFDSHNVPFWSEHEGCYLCYLRDGSLRDTGERDPVWCRSVARSQSDDFLHWSIPVLMDMGDTPPEQLYTNATQPYFRAPHIYTAMPGRFMSGRRVITPEEEQSLGVAMYPDGTDGYGADCSDAVFMTSRGGNRYDRTFMEAFVRPGRDRRNWTSRCNYPACGLVQTAFDELSMYVERHNTQATKYLERLTLRLDGFASLHAGYGGGQMLTKLLTFSGSQLELNYETSAAGHARVGIEDEQGQPIDGLALDDCDLLIGDEIDRKVTWGGRTHLSQLAGRTLRLRFDLKDADVYALQFTE